MSTAQSLGRRALIALLLFIGFYLLALIMVGILLAVPISVIVTSRHVNFLVVKLGFFCVVGAGIILWSIIPRRDHFQPPGPHLTESSQPRLFGAIRQVADRLAQPMPKELFLIPESNAWVMERGGMMGFGSRRVMGIGLPLLHELTVSELQSVIAHEFGHFHRGDTKLGPWIYRTRAAIARTIIGLEEHSSLIQKPFLWYGNGFLRVTHAISREQEFTADRLAAGFAGVAVTKEALRKIHGYGSLFEEYWHVQVLPVLHQGHLPPVFEGFESLLPLQNIQEKVQVALTEAMKQFGSDPFDTHPTLPERLAALKDAPATTTAADNTTAITLLERRGVLEEKLLHAMLPKEFRTRLSPISWAEVGEKLYANEYRQLADKYAVLLSAYKVRQVPEIIAEPQELYKRLAGEDTKNYQTSEAVEAVLKSACAAVLMNQGWSFEIRPGQGGVFTRDGKQFALFRFMDDLKSGVAPAPQWAATMEQLGIVDLPLH
jgi:heat shock protein HtpX